MLSLSRILTPKSKAHLWDSAGCNLLSKDLPSFHLIAVTLDAFRCILSTCSPWASWHCIWPSAVRRRQHDSHQWWDHSIMIYGHYMPLFTINWWHHQLWISLTVLDAWSMDYFEDTNGFQPWGQPCQARSRLSAMESAGAGKDLTAVEVRHCFFGSAHGMIPKVCGGILGKWFGNAGVGLGHRNWWPHRSIGDTWKECTAWSCFPPVIWALCSR